MAKTSVALLWWSSSLVAVAAGISSPRLLTQGELADAQKVVAQLKVHQTQADKDVARRLFDYGIQAKRKRRWGAAAKSFAESAMRHPTPAALSEYATAFLHTVGPVRSREGALERHRRADLGRSLSIYRSALAADAETRMLTDGERKRLNADIACLDDYLKTTDRSRPCPPLQAYGVPPGDG